MLAQQHMTLTVDGETRAYGQWAKILGCRPGLIRGRIRRGWTPRQAVGRDEPPVPRVHFGRQKRANELIEFQELQLQEKQITVPDYQATGKRARKIRDLAGVTTDVAAEQMCICQSAYSRLEHGYKWTPELIARFNEVAKGWVKRDECCTNEAT